MFLVCLPLSCHLLSDARSLPLLAGSVLSLQDHMHEGLTPGVQRIVQSIFDVIYIQRTSALAVIHDSMLRFEGQGSS